MTSAAALARVATAAAHAGGAVLTARFGAPARGVASKTSATDLVSDTDRAAEAAVLAELRTARPDDTIVAEEGGGTEAGAGAGDAGVRWLVDPLDGTINYLWGIPHWCVSVAALDRDGLVAGVVHDPLRAETFVAARGGGATRNGTALALGDGPPLAEALVGTGFDYRAEERVRQAARMPDLLAAARDVRRFGAAALDLAWVACGRLDGYFETGVQPWDWASGALLVREAGGAVRELPARAGRAAGILAAPTGLVEPLHGLVWSRGDPT